MYLEELDLLQYDLVLEYSGDNPISKHGLILNSREWGLDDDEVWSHVVDTCRPPGSLWGAMGALGTTTKAYDYWPLFVFLDTIITSLYLITIILYSTLIIFYSFGI